MAFDAPGAYQYSYPADVDMSDITQFQFTAVAIGPAQNVQGNDQGNAALVAYADGANFVGILQNLPKQGEAGTVMFNGFSRCIAATDWAAGDKLKVVTGGKLAKAGSGDAVFATAAISAKTGDTSTCRLAG